MRIFLIWLNFVMIAIPVSIAVSVATREWESWINIGLTFILGCGLMMLIQKAWKLGE